MNQCNYANSIGARCIYWEHHKCDHYCPSDGQDHSDTIRLQLVRERRDELTAEVTKLRALVAEACDIAEDDDFGWAGPDERAARLATIRTQAGLEGERG